MTYHHAAIAFYLSSPQKTIAKLFFVFLLPFLVSPYALAEQLSAGQLLIASKQLRDPNFSQTVILLTYYDDQQAAGIVINRPTHITASTALPHVEALKDDDSIIYLGGPVATSSIRILLRSSIEVPASTRIHNNLYFTDDATSITLFLKHATTPDTYWLYAGYAGWSAGQLEREIQKGSWHIINRWDLTLLDMRPELIWPSLIESVSGMWALKSL